MGNLQSIAPSQIFPVEHYLIGFENEVIYESSLGSTRFLKVARAKSEEGLVVVKVFVKNDPTIPLEIHAEKIESIKKNLQHAANCLPFQKVLSTDRAGIITREYVKHSLYDRLSTRPFLTNIEKKWITFQLLCALHQCHKQKICHGDIKLENILITSWNWILLSDFASFKPTYLPEDNPSDYSYFFDTSRKRTCYIAPERFVKSLTNDSKDAMMVGDSPCYSGNLLPEMDIFSAGCALLELWGAEGIGTAPFEFSQLLSYRNGDVELMNRYLNCVEDENLRSLLTSMLSLNPKERKSAEIYLDMERGRLFPEYFYSFLQSYIPITFCSIPVTPCDDKILKLHSDISQIIDIIVKENQVDDGLILITTLVTSCIRGLYHCNSKISVLEILHKIAQHTSSETILDRILPFILHLTQDISANVRVAALDTLTSCLCLVKTLPRSDANIFPEYVLPSIASLACDPSTNVRVAYAQNIAKLAETAVRYLEQSQLAVGEPVPNYETELHDLHEMLSTSVMSLLTDQQTIVKQALMENGITKLCVFFGSQKANDIILSHIITFLNDKEDKNLRGTFFDCIVGIATFIGWHCSPILIPLLQQGFSDTEEFVIAKAIRATTSVIELGLIQKQNLVELINDCACFLNHPNIWIRHEVCGLISTTAKILSPLDVQCKIMPAIQPHLGCPLIQVENIELLLNCLHPPIPRNVYDIVLKFGELKPFLDTLKDRKIARTKAGPKNLAKFNEMTPAVKNLFRRLESQESINTLIEAQLLSMGSHLLKVSRYRSHDNKKSKDGRIELENNHIGFLHEISLVEKPPKIEVPSRKHRVSESASADWLLNSEFVSPSLTSPMPDTLSLNAQKIDSTPSMSLVEFSMPERVFNQERFAECKIDLDQLFHRLKTKQALKIVKSNDNRTNLLSDFNFSGNLVAHLHEHRNAVTRMTTLKSNGSLFASTSTDGTVRLWDCSKLDGHQNINKSRQSYSANTPLNAIAACDAGQSLAVAGRDGALLVLRIDSNSSKMALQQARHLDSNTRIDRTVKENDDGPVVEMQAMDQGSQSLVVYATLYGAIVGWDIRMPGNAWRLESDLRNGVITSFTIDPTNSSWLALGTSSGRHLAWDLRFRLKIAEIKHPHEARIRRVACHPTEPSCLISASQGNNEVFSWNIETSSRQLALWASPAPPLSNINNSTHSVCALLPGVVDGRGFLITGGTDQRIRFWDLQDASNCKLVVPAPKDFPSASISYDSRPIDGTYVIQEIYNTNQTSPNTSVGSSRINSDEFNAKTGPDLPSHSHHDVITDLVLCKTQKQTFVASSSRDGVIKLWK